MPVRAFILAITACGCAAKEIATLLPLKALISHEIIKIAAFALLLCNIETVFAESFSK